MTVFALLLLSLHLTQDVLAGTATRKLSSYQFATNASLVTGRYTAETGGARLELSISEIPAKPGAYVISRSYYEPGKTLLRKSYVNIQRSADGHWEGRGGLKLRIPRDPKQGPVVLETSSGVEAISNSIWIQYRPAPAEIKKQ
jgi:hypothetical protein